jgi:hypothetical protein
MASMTGSVATPPAKSKPSKFEYTDDERFARQRLSLD